MNMSHGFRKRIMYHKKLFICIFVVGTLTLLLSGGITFGWFSRYISREIVKMEEVQLQNIANIYEVNIEQYKQKLQTTFQNNSMRSYLLNFSKDDFYQEYEAARYLQNLISNDSTISQIVLFNQREDILHTGPAYIPQKQLDDIIRKAANTSDDEDSFLVDIGGSRKLCMLQTAREHLNGNSQYGILFFIDLEELQEHLLAEENKDILLILDKKGNRIAGDFSRYGDAGAGIREQVAAAGTGYGSIESYVGESRYICTYYKDLQRGYQILSLKDFQSSFQELIYAQRMIILLSILLLLGVLVISGILTKVLSRPWEHLLYKLQNNAGLILPEEDLKSINQLDAAMDKVIGRMSMVSEKYNQDKVIRYLHEGNPEEEIPENLDPAITNKQLVLVLCQTEAKKELNRFQMYGAKWWKEAGCHADVYAERKGYWLFLLYSEPGQAFSYKEKQLEEKAGEICSRIEKEYGIKAKMAFTPIVHSREELLSAWKKLSMNMKYFVIGESTPVVITEKWCADKVDEAIPIDYIETVLDSVKTGDAEQARQEGRTLLKRLDRYQVKRSMMYLAGLASDLKNIRNPLPVKSKEYREDFLNNYLAVISFGSREEIDVWLDGLIGNTCCELSIAKERTLRTNMMESLEYIQENFVDRNLSVETVSEQFNMSISYFSKLFKESTGVNFPEYVNELRLNRANEILKNNPNVSVKRAAEVSGFGSLSYFSTQFKKKYGISPSQMKMIIEK